MIWKEQYQLYKRTSTGVVLVFQVGPITLQYFDVKWDGVGEPPIKEFVERVVEVENVGPHCRFEDVVSTDFSGRAAAPCIDYPRLTGYQ